MIKLSSIFIIPVVLSVFLFAGSVNAQENPYALETKVLKNEQAVQNLRQQQANLYLKMEDLLVKYGELLGKIQDMSHRLDAVEARLNNLASSSGRMQNMNSRPIQTNQYAAGQNGTNNMQTLKQNSSAITPKPQRNLPSIPKGQANMSTAAKTKPPKQAIITQTQKVQKKTPVISSDKTAYLAAKNLYYAKRYRAAAEAFNSFKRKYKTSKYMPDAIFYLAQSHFNIGEYDKAIISYDYLINTYPKNRNIPVALLREGISFIKLGDNIDGKYLLKKTIHSYPNSKEAVAAKRYLSKLK